MEDYFDLASESSIASSFFVKHKIDVFELEYSIPQKSRILHVFFVVEVEVRMLVCPRLSNDSPIAFLSYVGRALP